MYAALMSLGMGAASRNAANPNGYSAPSWVGSTLGKMDPIGNWITGIGGDPLNLYGNKNNPNALFFPGPGKPGVAQPVGSGFDPAQLAQLSQSYNTFLKNLGAGGTPMLPTGGSKTAAKPSTPPDPGTLHALSGGGGGIGGGRNWRFGPWNTP